MIKRETYFKVFNILNTYWESNKIDELGRMLSDMSPYTFVSDEYVSADPAVYEDWGSAWERTVMQKDSATPMQVFEVAKTILDYYQHELGYDLGGSEDYLRDQLGLKKSKLGRTSSRERITA